MAADLYMSSLVMFSDMDSGQVASNQSYNGHNTKRDRNDVFIVSGVQVVLYLVLLFWYFFLIWKTFLFRFGLLGQLIKDFPVIVGMPIFFGIFVAERGARIVSGYENVAELRLICLVLVLPASQQGQRDRSPQLQCPQLA